MEQIIKQKSLKILLLFFSFLLTDVICWFIHSFHECFHNATLQIWCTISKHIWQGTFFYLLMLLLFNTTECQRDVGFHIPFTNLQLGLVTNAEHWYENLTIFFPALSNPVSVTFLYYDHFSYSLELIKKEASIIMKKMLIHVHLTMNCKLVHGMEVRLCVDCLTGLDKSDNINTSQLFDGYIFWEEFQLLWQFSTLRWFPVLLVVFNS